MLVGADQGACAFLTIFSKLYPTKYMEFRGGAQRCEHFVVVFCQKVKRFHPLTKCSRVIQLCRWRNNYIFSKRTIVKIKGKLRCFIKEGFYAKEKVVGNVCDLLIPC